VRGGEAKSGAGEGVGVLRLGVGRCRRGVVLGVVGEGGMERKGGG